jgi:hypothetical protein
MLVLEIDSMGTDPGNAFLYPHPSSAVRDARMEGRFGRTYRYDEVTRRNVPTGVYLETYASDELDGYTGEAFGRVYVEASSRKAAIGKLLRQLGYPRGTEFEIINTRD